MVSILLVEDEARIREFISLYLKKEDYNVIEAKNGKEALALFGEYIDLVVLDIMMPIVNGFEVCNEIRKNSSVPIIILTAVESEDDHIKGYELGADDYVTKPFKINILLAKIKRILKKEKDQNIRDVFSYENMTFDFSGRELKIDNRNIKIAPKEFELLEYIIRNKGIALSRNQILENVWGYDFEGEDRVVDNHIKKIRSKLGEYSYLLKTVVSVGYKFDI